MKEKLQQYVLKIKSVYYDVWLMAILGRSTMLCMLLMGN
jgi:hypothetical protein